MGPFFGLEGGLGLAAGAIAVAVIGANMVGLVPGFRSCSDVLVMV